MSVDINLTNFFALCLDFAVFLDFHTGNFVQQFINFCIFRDFNCCGIILRGVADHFAENCICFHGYSGRLSRRLNQVECTEIAARSSGNCVSEFDCFITDIRNSQQIFPVFY